MRPALLVVDIQNRFYKMSPETAQSLNLAVYFINEAIKLFRESNFPIIAIQHMNQTGGLIPGTEDFEIPPSVNLIASDLRIHKTYKNSFNKTELTEKLRGLGIDTVIITGFCAEHCVLHTYCGAESQDFAPIMLKEALASYAPEHIHMVEEITEIMTVGALKAALSKSKE
jgi:nicotinamidase-related amidase